MRLFLVIILCAAGFVSLSQSIQIDSLQRLIDKEGDSKRKVELLNQLSFRFFGFDVEKAGASTQLALQVSQNIGDSQGEGWATAYRGVYFLFSGELKNAEEYFDQSLKLGRNLQDHNLQVYSLNQLGNVFRDKGVFDSAYHFYQQAEVVVQRHPDKYYQSVVKMSKGRYYLILNKPDSALLQTKEAMLLRESLSDSELMPDVWLLLGNCYRDKYELNEAERYYNLALHAESLKSTIHAQYLINMGEVYFSRGDFQKALANWSEVLAYNRKLNYKYELARLLYRMGEVFEEQGYYDLANEYLSNALTISEKAPFISLSGEIYYELAWVYYRSKNLELAIQNIQKAQGIFKQVKQELRLAGCLNLKGLIQMKKNDNDSSLYYHLKSLKERERIGDKVAVSGSLYNLGELYNVRKEYGKALAHLWRGVKIDEAIGDHYGMSLYYYQLGKSYNLLGGYDSARYYLDRAIQFAIPTSATENLRYSYFEMADYLQHVGKPNQAIGYYKKYIQLSDSLFSKQTAQTMASFRTLYDVGKKEQEIDLLNKTNQLAKSQAQRQRILFYVVVAGLLILVALATFYYRFAKRMKKLNYNILEKNEEIQTQAEELTESNEALSKLNREISEQKEEIQAQAEELTEANQTIIGINESLEERIEVRTAELKQAFKELDTFFYRSSHDFRRPLTTFMGLAEVAKITIKDKGALDLFEKVNETAHNLDKMLMKLQSISDLGVQELIYKEVFVKDILRRELSMFDQELLQKGIRTEMEVDSELSFHSYPALVKIMVDNLIENAINFRGDTDSFIRLKAYTKNNEVIMEVEDNGHGIEQEYIGRVFDMYFRGNEHSKGNGLGLYIVKKTADKLKARVTFRSIAGKGSKISIFFPFQVENTAV